MRFWLRGWLDWWRCRACRRGKHAWELKEIALEGVLTAVPVCARPSCTAVDVDRIVQTSWNRAARRRWHRALKAARP